MNKKLRTSSMLCVGLMLVTVSACADGEAIPSDCEPTADFDTVEEGTLTVAVNQQLPAIDIDVNSGEMEGVDSVLLPEFAEENCLELDMQPLDGSAAVAALTEGRADVGGGGWYKTEEREEALGQSETLWYDQPSIVSSEGIDSIGGLEDQQVGVVGGSLFEEPLADAIGSSNVVSYQSIDAIFNDLQAGRLDAAMGAEGTLTIQLADRGQDDQQVTPLGQDSEYPVLTTPGEPNYPYTQSNSELGEALDEFIIQAKGDDLIEEALAEYEITSETALEGPSN